VLWKLPTGEVASTLDDGGASIDYLAFSPDGQRLAAGHKDGIVRLWDVPAASLVRRLEGHAAGSVALGFHPRAGELVTASGKELRRWDAASGSPRGSLPGAASTVMSLAHSPDGTRIAAGLGNATLELWESASAEVLLRQPYAAGVWWVGWARDGQGLFALPMDETVRVLRARQ
jgi:WD40 repeat protein